MVNLERVLTCFICLTSVLLTGVIYHMGTGDVPVSHSVESQMSNPKPPIPCTAQEKKLMNERPLDKTLTSARGSLDEEDSFDLDGLDQTCLSFHKVSSDSENAEFILSKRARSNEAGRNLYLKNLAGEDLDDDALRGCTYSYCSDSSVTIDDPVVFHPPGSTFWPSFSLKKFSFLCISIMLCLSFFFFLARTDKSLPEDDTKRADQRIVLHTVDAEVKGITEKRTQIGGELLLDLDGLISQSKHTRVYRGTYCQKPVAVKVSYKAGSSQDAARPPAEAKNLKRLCHPHVVTQVMSGTYVPPQTRSRLSYSAGMKRPKMPYETYIVMEYCDRGTLHQAIRNQMLSSSTSFDQVATCALEIAQAMAHMHAKCILHGALHTRNILLQSDSSDPRGFCCKVGGFGSSLRLHRGSHSIQFNRVPNISIAAPEVLQSGLMSYASDVYAYGILLYTLCVRRLPFPGMRSSEIQRYIVSGDRPAIPGIVPAQLAALIRECWSSCTHERPSFVVVTQKLEDFVASQQKEKRRSQEYKKKASHCTPSLLEESSDPGQLASLVPGKRYACINFQPCTSSRRHSPTQPCIELASVRQRRHSTPRRTKSCIISIGKELGVKETTHEAFVRHVDELIKRSRRSDSKTELKQFLNTLAVN